MEKSSLFFCIGSVAMSLLVAILAFPYVAMDSAIITAANATVPAYEMGSYEVGEGFGEVPVEEMMTYYVENPPAVLSGPAPRIRFGGC